MKSFFIGNLIANLPTYQLVMRIRMECDQAHFWPINVSCVHIIIIDLVLFCFGFDFSIAKHHFHQHLYYHRSTLIMFDTAASEQINLDGVTNSFLVQTNSCCTIHPQLTFLQSNKCLFSVEMKRFKKLTFSKKCYVHLPFPVNFEEM